MLPFPGLLSPLLRISFMALNMDYVSLLELDMLGYILG